MIFLQPHSGLANRIRVIISGLAFSEKEGQRLVIYWEKDPGLHCDFYDLFEKNEALDVRSYDIRLRVLDRMKNKGFLKNIFDKLFKIDFSLFDKDFDKYVWNKKSDYLDMELVPAGVRNYYIKTCNEFFFERTYLKYLKPTKPIRERIDQMLSKFPSKITGIHIRRTDNDRSILESPLELFIEKIKLDGENDPDMHYYLATDDPRVEQELMDQFPGKILSAKKLFTRSSEEGIIGAMVDLYCLAGTNKIYGSYWSSFSSVAARIGNIPLIVVKK